MTRAPLSSEIPLPPYHGCSKPAKPSKALRGGASWRPPGHALFHRSNVVRGCYRWTRSFRSTSSTSPVAVAIPGDPRSPAALRCCAKVHDVVHAWRWCVGRAWPVSWCPVAPVSCGLSNAVVEHRTQGNLEKLCKLLYRRLHANRKRTIPSLVSAQKKDLAYVSPGNRSQKPSTSSPHATPQRQPITICLKL